MAGKRSVSSSGGKQVGLGKRYYKNGQLWDEGTYEDGRKQLGGVLLLDAADLNQAAELMSKHPGIRVAAFEIRPLDEEANSWHQHGREFVSVSAQAAA